MVVDMGYWARVFKKIVIFIISLLILYLVFKLAVFYMPFLIAFIISLFVEPLIKKIVKKTRITRKKVAVIVIILIFMIIIGLLVWGIISLIMESSNLLQKLNIYIEMGYYKINEFIYKIRSREIVIPEQVLNIAQNSFDKVINNITNYVSETLTNITHIISKLPIVGIYVFITILSTYFICTDKMYMLDQIEHHLPRIWVKKIGVHLKNIIKSLGNYLKAEATLVFISFIITLVGLYIIKIAKFNIPYPLLTAIGIAFVDALPILRFRNCNDTMGDNICNKW